MLPEVNNSNLKQPSNLQSQRLNNQNSNFNMEKNLLTSKSTKIKMFIDDLKQYNNNSAKHANQIKYIFPSFKGNKIK